MKEKIWKGLLVASPWLLSCWGQMRKSESWFRKPLQQPEHPADAKTRLREDNSISENVLQRKPPWSYSFTHVSHVGVKSTLHHVLRPTSPVRSLSLQCSVYCGGRGPSQNVGSCSGSWPVSTLMISTVWSLCFPIEVSGLPPTPRPVSENTHKQAHSDVFCTYIWGRPGCWLVAKAQFRGTEQKN